MLYNLNENWNFGFSYKSPIYQERWGYNAANQVGSARYIGVQASLPEIISWGVAYKGLPKTLIDVDLRYFDYKDAALFGQSVRERGLGWRSVFAVATGAQYQLSEKSPSGAAICITPIRSLDRHPVQRPSPRITQHTLSLGASYRVTTDITATAAWVHGFRNAISGGVEQLPGASTRLDTQTDSLVFGLNISLPDEEGRSSPSQEYLVPTPAPAAMETSQPSPPPVAVAVAPVSGETTLR